MPNELAPEIFLETFDERNDWSRQEVYKCRFDSSEKSLHKKLSLKTCKHHTFTKKRVAIEEGYVFLFTMLFFETIFSPALKIE